MKGKVLIFSTRFSPWGGVITRSAEMYDNLKTVMPGDFFKLKQEKLSLHSIKNVKMSRDANRHVLVHLTD